MGWYNGGNWTGLDIQNAPQILYELISAYYERAYLNWRSEAFVIFEDPSSPGKYITSSGATQANEISGASDFDGLTVTQMATNIQYFRFLLSMINNSMPGTYIRYATPSSGFRGIYMLDDDTVWSVSGALASCPYGTSWITLSDYPLTHVNIWYQLKWMVQSLRYMAFIIPEPPRNITDDRSNSLMLGAGSPPYTIDDLWAGAVSDDGGGFDEGEMNGVPLGMQIHSIATLWDATPAGCYLSQCDDDYTLLTSYAPGTRHKGFICVDTNSCDNYTANDDNTISITANGDTFEVASSDGVETQEYSDWPNVGSNTTLTVTCNDWTGTNCPFSDVGYPGVALTFYVNRLGMPTGYGITSSTRVHCDCNSEFTYT